MDQLPPPPPPPPPPGSTPGAGGGFGARGIGDILSEAFELYRANYVVLWQIVAVVVVPLTILQYYLTDSALALKKRTIETALGKFTVTTTSTSFGRTVLLLFVGGLIAALITQVLTGAIARAAAGTLVGETLTVGGAFEYGFARLWSILLVGLLVALAVVVGLILLVIPGIIAAVMFSVALPALVVEGKRGTEAMRRSWDLVSGHFWHVLGAYIVAFLIAGVVNAMLAALFQGWFLSGVAAAGGSILTTPFTALVAMLIYLDVRVRTEGLTEDRLRADLRGSGT